MRNQFVAHEDDPVMLASSPTARPGDYHRSISVAWWAAAVIAGGVVWVALLG